MSVVAVKVYPEGCEFASDSITVRGYSQRKDGLKSKLCEVNGIVIGGVGTAEETALFQVYLRTRQPARADSVAILDLVTEFAEWKKSRTEKYPIENDYILGFGGKAWMISGFYISEISSFHAIGAGADFATAALFLGHDVRRAVQTAVELFIYCESPINWISTRR